jgi:hypothetical protein
VGADSAGEDDVDADDANEENANGGEDSNVKGNTKKKGAVEEAAPEEMYPLAPETRKCNGKVYPVLSIQEASRINYLVNIEFWIMAMIPVSLVVFGMWILISARTDYRDAIA